MIINKLLHHPLQTFSLLLVLSTLVVYSTILVKHPVTTVTQPRDTAHGSGLSVSQQPEDIQHQWLDAINAERSKAGVAQLQLDPRIESSAARKAQEMNAEGIDSTPHLNNQGIEGYTYIQQADPACVRGAENIAWDYNSIPDTVDAWMASPGHRANLLSSKYSLTGFSSVGRFTVEHFCGGPT